MERMLDTSGPYIPGSEALLQWRNGIGTSSKERLGFVSNQ